MCLASTTAYSLESTTSTQLNTQTTVAEPAHLTTRIQWTKFPQLQFEDADLKSQDRYAIVRIKANESGKVVDASVKESTGIQKLDQMLLKAIYAAKTKPFKKDGNELSIIGYQTFSLKLNEDTENCPLNFNSKVWQAQQAQKKTTFTYLNQPQLNITSNDLNGHNRKIKFTFKVNKQGDATQVKINTGSGVYALDQALKQAVLAAQVKVPRKYWVYKKSKLKDEIMFNLNDCQSPN